MARKPARKQPRQARSRATVTGILDATTRILDREGPDAATTTRVAEVAGISIGTLYQYFSHRDAILDALQDREFERAMELMQRVLAAGAIGPGREVARRVIEGLLKLYAAAPGLHRVLALEGLRVASADRVHAFDLHVVSVVRTFLSMSSLPIRRTNIDAAAFVVFQSVRASMLSRMLEHPPGLDDETLTEELADMIYRYLVDDPQPGREPPRPRRGRARKRE
ncbi:MAG: TetR/AcrR family transcriptional regulator [Polyangiales bacterium]